MNKALLTSILLIANLSTDLIACDFHDDEYLYRYHFPRVNPQDPSEVSQTGSVDRENKVNSENGVKKRVQPDFRYTSVRTTNNINNISASSP